MLAFALEIEGAYPDVAGEEGAEIPQEAVSAIYSTTIFGGINAVATGGSNVSQNVEIAVRPGDLDSLLTYVRGLGLSDDDVQELREALEQDGDQRDTDGFGPRAKAWLGKAMAKLATGTMVVAGAATGQLLAAALAKYFGLVA